MMVPWKCLHWFYNIVYYLGIQMAGSEEDFSNNSGTLKQLACVQPFVPDCPRTYKSESWPGQPENLQWLERRDYRDEPGLVRLNITWQPPSDSSIRFIKGFELVIIFKGKRVGQSACYFFDLPHINLREADIHKTFSYNCLKMDSDAAVIVHSVPRRPSGFGKRSASSDFFMPPAPTWNEISPVQVSSSAPQATKTTGRRAQKMPVPALWGDYNIDIHKQGLSLRVQFKPAPPLYNFTSYQLSIAFLGAERVISSVVLTDNHEHIFQLSEEGNYSLCVEAEEAFPDLPCRCVCKMTFKRCDYMGCAVGCLEVCKVINVQLTEQVTRNQKDEAQPDFPLWAVFLTATCIVTTVVLALIVLLKPSKKRSRCHILHMCKLGNHLHEDTVDTKDFRHLEGRSSQILIVICEHVFDLSDVCKCFCHVLSEIGCNRVWIKTCTFTPEEVKSAEKVIYMTSEFISPGQPEHSPVEELWRLSKCLLRTESLAAVVVPSDSAYGTGTFCLLPDLNINTFTLMEDLAGLLNFVSYDTNGNLRNARYTSPLSVPSSIHLSEALERHIWQKCLEDDTPPKFSPPIITRMDDLDIDSNDVLFAIDNINSM